MISIIHPSRQRPEKSFNTINKWLRMASEPVELILSLDEDDPKLDEYRFFYPLNPNTRLVIGDNKNAVQAINTGALFAKGDILIVVSDDTDCFKDWDKVLNQIKSKRDNFIVKFQDGIQPWIITMPVMDRDYYESFGYIYHPSYEHCFCDTELTCVAELTGRLVFSTLKFPHNHYSIGKTSKDSVSDKADSTFESGRKNFIDRKKRNFDLRPDQIKGFLPDNVYTRMQ